MKSKIGVSKIRFVTNNFKSEKKLCRPAPVKVSEGGGGFRESIASRTHDTHIKKVWRSRSANRFLAPGRLRRHTNYRAPATEI